MSKTIQRLRYFDGEFLRSADLDTEQNYHVEMRRRLNSKLHLFGVVEGLEIVNQPDANKVGLTVFAVTPGFAIDYFGREIVVNNDEVLDDTVLALNQVTQPGTYDVWLCYLEDAMTPPSIGMQDCAGSAASQYTRWREDFKVVLILSTTTLPVGLDNQPQPGLGGVQLGSVTITKDASGRLVVGPTAPPGPRKFVGLRAQSIRLPEDMPQTVDITVLDQPPSPLSWLTIEPNTAVLMNQLIGPNYLIDRAKIQPPLNPGDIPDAGNLKIAGNIFVKGKQYLQDNGSMVELEHFIKSRTPDVQIGSGTVTPGPTADGGKTQSGDETITITSPVTAPTADTRLTVALTGLNFGAHDDVGAWFADIPGTGIDIEVSLEGFALTKTATPGSYKGSFHWKVGPSRNTSKVLVLKSFSYSYVAVLKL